METTFQKVGGNGHDEKSGAGREGSSRPEFFPSEHTILRPGWAAEPWHRTLSWERVPGHPDLSLFLDPSL